MCAMPTASDTAPPTQNPNETPGITPTPSEIAAAEGCVAGQVNLTSPLNGDRISGSISVRGSASVDNFGFYTLQIAHPGDVIWLPIQVGQQGLKNEVLGTWDSSTLTPGAYLLRLVVTDNVGNLLTPCAIQVTVDPLP